MQRVLLLQDMAHIEHAMDRRVVDYIAEGQIEAFEVYADYNIIAFEWYDITNDTKITSQILVYMDREDLIILCEDGLSLDAANKVFQPEDTNEHALFGFFIRLLKDDMQYLDAIEDRITALEDNILVRTDVDVLYKVNEYRNELLSLKRYYEQFLSTFEDLKANSNELLSEDAVRRFDILENRTSRFYADVVNMQAHVSQVREAYQAQIDIEQNQIMKVFTVVTVIFLPLTLLVGWYGMNLRMPEYGWKYGYPVIMLASVGICLGLYIYFKRKKWF